jgi:hypothetical protein
MITSEAEAAQQMPHESISTAVVLKAPLLLSVCMQACGAACHQHGDCGQKVISLTSAAGQQGESTECWHYCQQVWAVWPSVLAPGLSMPQAGRAEASAGPCKGGQHQYR